MPTPGQSTLWQDLPDVRASGVLEQLTQEQCKYQEVRDGKRGGGGLMYRGEPPSRKINEARRGDIGDAASHYKSHLQVIM